MSRQEETPPILIQIRNYNSSNADLQTVFIGTEDAISQTQADILFRSTWECSIIKAIISGA